MAAITRRDLPFQVLELPEWLEGPMAGWREFARLIRVEEYVADQRYVVRAELPGVDPVKGIEVMVDDGMLRIEAERPEESREQCRTEFQYGKLHRTVRLPKEARGQEAKAAYHDGILEITFALAEERKPAARRITVTPAK
ncbi:Hsp20/alpha crystallin family protein [Actinomadura sp. ATCC 31491]|uniref:Hsp20/alpha crystallin family protein n=1 Tax=Actinomadura luzonensis TaxID=2805427 RepID=A0ABT0G236_9ACTN|nr:Hsp20/alpha crystallin family protein [Actinomadura luzonensis]MCK2218602.1 Hsp20/alpha crystallin family protein [Actinomadura luzonensis]